jgi:hypothetical protein
LEDSKFQVGLDILTASGKDLVCERSKVTYPLQLAAADSMCLDLSFTGLYTQDSGSDPDYEKYALLVANGYFAETPGDSATLRKATVVEVETMGNVLVQSSGTWKLEWVDQKPEKMNFFSGFSDIPHTKVGSLGDKNWAEEWDMQVWATDDDSIGAVFHYGAGVVLIGQIPGKMPLEHNAWDITNLRNSYMASLGTALSNGLDKHALFIGQYSATDTTYTVDPADSPIKAEMTGSTVIPPPDWMDQASKDLVTKGIDRAFVVDAIVDSVNMKVGYVYQLAADLTPRAITLVARNGKMVVRDGRALYTLSFKGKIDKFPSVPKPPGPGPPGPGPSGGGGGGGRCCDDTGLMVALLLGLLAYALMKY